MQLRNRRKNMKKEVIKKCKVSKGMRKQMFDLAYQDDRGDNNYISLRDILDGSEQPNEILPKVEKYLDEYCNNSHFSRWTNFGDSLYQEAMYLAKQLSNIYDEFLC